VRTLNDDGIETDAPIEVAVWTNEEGTRFTPVMMGSGVFAGVFELEYRLARTDLEGKSVGDELTRIGYAGAAAVGRRIFAAYFEAHIEQGPILEDTGNTVGVVTGALGLRWYDVVVTGQDSHAGPTPMACDATPCWAQRRSCGRSTESPCSTSPKGVARWASCKSDPTLETSYPGRCGSRSTCATSMTSSWTR
jgi:acetylornithine deacetylase/succinyl-diaminopimelate desuccinylase-like protein